MNKLKEAKQYWMAHPAISVVVTTYNLAKSNMDMKQLCDIAL